MPAWIAATLNNLGRVAQVRDDFLTAARFYGESFMLCERIGDTKGAETALTNSAELAFFARRFLHSTT